VASYIPDTPIAYSPYTGRPWVSKDTHVGVYRQLSYNKVFHYNPWTGEERLAADVNSDPLGLTIVPPGSDLIAA
jgi:hypothetical protein